MTNERIVWSRHMSTSFHAQTQPVTHDLALVPTTIRPQDIVLPASQGRNGTVVGPQEISDTECRDLCPIAQGMVRGVRCSKMRRASQGYAWGIIAGQHLPNGEADVRPGAMMTAEISSDRIVQIDLGPTSWKFLAGGKVQEAASPNHRVSDLFEVAVHEGIVPCMEDGEIGIFNPEIVTVRPSHPSAPQLTPGIQSPLFSAED